MAQYVSPKYRTNVLSRIPGGCTIIITHKNCESFIYDKIKYPKKYLDKVLQNPNIVAAYLNNELVWKAEPIAPRKLLKIDLFEKTRNAA